MKLSKQQEAHVMLAYNAYWENYLKGDVEAMIPLLDDGYTQVGSAESEVFFNKKDAVQFLYDTIDQVAGKLEMRNRSTKLEQQDSIILLHELCDVYVLAGKEWNFYSKFRASTLMQKKNTGWKIIHQHSSMPDLKTQEGENIAIEKISKENLELRDAIKRRTIELENKNHELEIEGSLERVRAQALSMKKPEDLPGICEILFDELRKLGFSELRNAMINIHDDKHGSFLNYDYSDTIGRSITHLSYNTHPLVEKQIKQIRSSRDAFSETSFRGKELDEWKAFRKKKGEKDDPRLENISSLYYYFYSIGTGSIGISTFGPIKAEKINVLKRFRNVFDFAYRRYMDVAQAEAQAREAQIELALERVRARTMAMQHSDELQDAAIVLFEQMKGLGVHTGSCGFNIWNQKEQSSAVWMSSAEGGLQEPFSMPHTESPIYKQVYEAKKAGENFLVIEVSGNDLKKHFDYLLLLPGIGDVIKNRRASDYKFPETMVFHFAFFSKGYLSFHLHEHHPETHELFKRFAKVFEQTYTRFLDLQKAEAQAREGQIELALERVRARTMAMQHSDELKVAAALLFQQVKSLGVPAYSCGYNIWKKNDTVFTSWMSTQDGSDFNAVLNIPLTQDANFIRFADSRQKGEQFFVLELRGERMQEHYKYLKTIPAFRAYFDYAISVGFNLPESQIHHIANFSQGNLLFITLEPCPEFHDVFKRFAIVFEQTYTRFLDLQKAEAQAHEAQIELALERVRARTMAMQKSDELKAVIQVVYDQFIQLNFHVEHSGIIIDYKARDDMHIWLADRHDVPFEVTIPYFDSPHWNSFNEAKEKGKDFFTNLLSFQEKNKFYQDLFNLIPGVPKETSDYYFNCPGLAISTVLLENVGLYIENFSGIPYSDDENSTLMRFGKVFQQTYTRFLDLQNAEAQAREAKIEAALEKVRGRAMAMHNSNDLSATASMVFTELRKLGIHPIRSGVGLLSKEQYKVLLYAATASSESHELSLTGEIDMSSHPCLKMQYESCLKKENYFPVLSGEELKSYYKNLATQIPVTSLTDEQYQHEFYGYYFPFSEGYFYVWTENAYSENEINILNRFKAITDLTFRRYLDLQKAEAQAREAKIEASLERVRSRTMGMQQSHELGDVATVLFKELNHLVENLWTCGFVLCEKDRREDEWWLSTGDGFIPSFYLPNTGDQTHANIFDAWKKGETYHTEQLEGEALQEHYDWLMNIPVSKNIFDDMKAAGNSLPTWQKLHCAYFSYGYLVMITKVPCPEEQIFKRFAQVFDQTYTRFLDLQKAEAQTREAKIETSLERIRARGLAMHKSEELVDASTVLFNELNTLGIETIRTGVGIVDRLNESIEVWSSELVNKKENKILGVVPAKVHPFFEGYYNAWEKKQPYFLMHFVGEEVKEFYSTISAFLSYPERESYNPNESISIFFFSEGSLNVVSLNPLTENECQLMSRFARVFGLIYTRFLDLKKAEAQAREAQIEVALERVRSRTLAMHKSDELAETAAILFKQLCDLEVAPNRLYIFIFNDETSDFESWITEEDGKEVSRMFKANTGQSPVFRKMYDGWKAKKKSITIDLQGKELADYIHLLSEELHAPVTIGHSQKRRVQSAAYFSQGLIGMASPEPQPEETLDLLEKFAGVFNLTYTRFNDLLVAEANAKNAQVEEQKLREEKKRSDSLLLNILPEEIANELKQFGKSYARKHDEVTILFADIKGFSSIAETLSAEALVTQLDECFRAFDNIVEKHGLEKIKTVGDAYVCACGLPKPVPDNAIKTVQAAMDMLDFLKGFGTSKKIQNLPAFEFRIGIHTGPVVTGVVGLKKFTYDIWGDAVNMAARMEQHGESGKINVSGNTYKFIKDKFTCTHRGKIEAKNKGEIDMYFVEHLN